MAISPISSTSVNTSQSGDDGGAQEALQPKRPHGHGGGHHHHGSASAQGSSANSTTPTDPNAPGATVNLTV